MKFINIHTHKYSNQDNILEIVNQFPKEFDDSLPNYSIGIHPWYIDENNLENELIFIDKKLQLNNCLALGECGLDKKIDIPLIIQIDILEKQLLLAEKYQKPIIIHCVAAFQEIIEIKKRLNLNVPMIIHGFSKNIQIANQLIDNDFYLSFGKYLIMNPELKSVFHAIPNERIFLETDSSNYNIKEIYKQATKYKNLEIKNLIEIMNTNFNKVFNKA